MLAFGTGLISHTRFVTFTVSTEMARRPACGRERPRAENATEYGRSPVVNVRRTSRVVLRSFPIGMPALTVTR